MLSAIITWLLKGWLSRWAITVEGEIKDGWRWLTASPAHFLAFALAVSIAANAWQHHRIINLQEARHSDAVAFQIASDQNHAAQVAVNHEPARVSGAIAREANATAPAYYDQLRRAADDHAVRMPAGEVGVGPSGLPRANPFEQGLHRPDVLAGLVCRPAEDDGLLVTAAGRAARMLAQAKSWIESGIAIAEPDDAPSATPNPQPTK